MSRQPAYPVDYHCSRCNARVLVSMIMLSCIIMLGSFQLVRDVDKEYKLKAAFVYNFIQYIDWSVAPPNDYVIGIIGSSPIEADLREIAATKTVGGKKIVVHQYSPGDDISGCNIVFVTREMSGSLERILDKATKGTLVIAEKPGCARQGAAINFITVDNKLRFETNLKAISAAGLKASSQLLKLAIVVD